MHNPIDDALADPLRVIKAVADKRNLVCSAPGFPAEVAAHFQGIFKDNERLKQITPLDPSFLLERDSDHAPRTLVRFRAMVQDTSISPELYPSVLSDGSPGAWGLAESTDLSDSSLPDLQSLRQREVIWAVTVPAESPFVSQLLDNAASPKVITSEVPRNDFLSPNRHKDPLLRTSHVGLQVKIYDTSIIPLKPTDICTFVGFLSRQHATLDDSLSGAGIDPNSDSYALHVLFTISHPPGYHPKPLESNSPLLNNHIFDTLRNELVDWIATEGLAGDRDVAVWVLLTCISRVFSRQPTILPLSLTISKCPISDNATRHPSLANVLQLILPSFLDISLSRSLINSRPFSPESQNDDLHAGLLQLPAGTTILFSEFEVGEGTINDCGVRNIQALKDIIESQYLSYTFPFVPPYLFPTDLPIIVLTSGDASLFVPTVANIPLECTAPDGVGCNCTPPEKIAAFQDLLRNTKTKDVHFAEDISEYIQSDFVLERQRAQGTTPDDLISWLNLSRLLALSYNRTDVTIDIWSEAKELEKRRKARLGN